MCTELTRRRVFARKGWELCACLCSCVCCCDLRALTASFVRYVVAVLGWEAAKVSWFEADGSFRDIDYTQTYDVRGFDDRLGIEVF